MWFCHWNEYWNECYWCHCVQPIYEAIDTKQKMNFSAECNIKIMSASQSSWVNNQAVLNGISMFTLVKQGYVNKRSFSKKLTHSVYLLFRVFVTSKLKYCVSQFVWKQSVKALLLPFSLMMARLFPQQSIMKWQLINTMCKVLTMFFQFYVMICSITPAL